MDAICSTFDWKMRSVASPATFEPRHFPFKVSHLRQQSLVFSVLLFEDFDHRLQVTDVYRLAQDAFRVVVLDDGLDAGHEGLVHFAVCVVLGFTSREWAVKRFTHDG
jgi:hypothetical protein